MKYLTKLNKKQIKKLKDIISNNNSSNREIKRVQVLNYKFLIADTPEYLVINKPPGLIVHGAKHIKEISLIDILLQKYPEIKKVGEDLTRPGIVHRIDKEVGGLMVIAKTKKSFDNLKSQFQNRKIKKQYIALVYGKIYKDEDKITFPIKRSNKGYKMAAVAKTKIEPLKKDGDLTHVLQRNAITYFKIIKRFINYTLLNIQIITGRTHQIRVHMLAYGHPIVGDNLYSTKKTRALNKKIFPLMQNFGLQPGKIFLFSQKLSFYDLTGKQQIFKIKMPNEFEKFIKQLK